MTTRFYLDLSIDVPVSCVLERLHRFTGGQVLQGCGKQGIRTPAMRVDVRKRSDDPWACMVLEEWGIEARLAVTFHLPLEAPVRLRAAAQLDMSVAAATMAVEYDADAVLHFESDRALMLRRDGVLFLYDWWPEWTNPLVANTLPRPHELITDVTFDAAWGGR